MALQRASHSEAAQTERKSDNPYKMDRRSALTARQALLWTILVLAAAVAAGWLMRRDEPTAARIEKAGLCVGCGLEKANFSGARFGGVDLTGADLRGADFSGVRLSGALWIDGEPYAGDSVGQCQRPSK